MQAFAIACRLTRGHCVRLQANDIIEPALPKLLSSTLPALPSNAQIPPPQNLSQPLHGRPLHEVFPGYGQIRLLAPNAEVRVMLAWLTSSINAHCLGQICEGLRGFLACESRQLTLVKTSPVSKLPPHLPPEASSAISCDVHTTSGYPVSVMVAGPAEILKDQALVQHALRQTMTADAQTLQFRLPPPNIPLPPVRSVPEVGEGCPSVEALVVTSAWCVQLLRMFNTDAKCRSLTAAGIVGIGVGSTASFQRSDLNRFTAVMTDNVPNRLELALNPVSQLVATDAILFGAQGAPKAASNQGQPPVQGQNSNLAAPTPAVGGGLPPRPGTVPDPRQLDAAQTTAAERQSFVLPNIPQPNVPLSSFGADKQLRDGTGVNSNSNASPGAGGVSGAREEGGGGARHWASERPPLTACSEKAFLEDLIKFTKERLGKEVNADNFPEVQLNGSALDVFNLYKEVWNVWTAFGVLLSRINEKIYFRFSHWFVCVSCRCANVEDTKMQPTL